MFFSIKSLIISFIFAGMSQFQSSETANSTPHLKVYGNSLEQEIRWLNISRNISNSYLLQMHDCAYSSRKFVCAGEVHDQHKMYFVEASSGKSCFNRDCSYYLHDIKSTSDSLSLRLEQDNCKGALIDKFSASEVLGGSSFDIFAWNNISISTCTTTDFFNNSYSVFCPIHTSNDKIFETSIYLSMVITTEYFQGFGEEPNCDLSTIDTTAVLFDNKLITILSSSINNNNNGNNIKNILQILPSLLYQRKRRMMKSWYSANWFVGIDQYMNYHKSRSPMITVSYPPFYANDTSRFKLMNQHILELNLSYYWIIEKKLYYSKNQWSPPYIIDNSSINHHHHHLNIDSSNRCSCISCPRRRVVKERIIFIGDSHARGFYDYFLSQSPHADKLLRIRMKHENHVFSNTYFYGALYSYSQRNELLNICNDTHTLTMNYKSTIILGLGHWDLSYASLRNLFQF